RAGYRGYPLYPAARIIASDPGRCQITARFGIFKAAIVADIDFPVRPDSRAIRPAAGLCDHILSAVGRTAGQLPCLALGQYDTAIRHRNRAFGKAKSICYKFHDPLHLFHFDHSHCGKVTTSLVLLTSVTGENMPDTYPRSLQLHIDGEWIEVEGRDIHHVVNPSTGKIISDLPKANKADLDRALD